MEGLDVKLGVARIECGGTNRNPIINVQDARFSKRALVSINNDDNLCLARALAVGIAKNNVGKVNDEETANAEKFTETSKKVIRRGKLLPRKGKHWNIQHLLEFQLTVKVVCWISHFLNMF